MKNLFNSVLPPRLKSSTFDLTHDIKLSLNMGDLVPVMCMECVPGDKVSIGCDQLLRFAPLIAPVMHRMTSTVHYFFVPNRLLWAGWEDWIKNPQEVVPNMFPTLEFGDANPYTQLADYFGIPLYPAGGDVEAVNAFPFAAYQMIYNEYYRDQNLIEPINYTLINGSNDANTALRTLRKRAWMHDYFTSALPTPQAGDPVSIPLGSQQVILDPLVDDPGRFVDPSTKMPSPQGNVETNSLGETQIEAVGTPQAVYDPSGTLITEDSGQATTITDLRRAVRLQEWLERLMRGGQRYVEMIQSMFGVRNPDARLQRPEYITGAKTPIQISEVLNTTGEDAGLPQGNMAGHGVAVTSGKMGRYTATEHGFIIGIMSVTPMTAYQQGLERFWLKTTDPLDYFWPQFENIGEQPIYNSEIYAYQGDAARETFGYIPRYAEYKYINSRVAGDFRDSLAYWHLSRVFEAPPSLNQTFVECTPRQDVFAVTDPSDQKLYCHHLNKLYARRAMGKYSTPSF